VPDKRIAELKGRELERTSKPTIKEVLEAIEEHIAEWQDRRLAIGWLMHRSHDLKAEIGKLQSKLELEQALANHTRANEARSVRRRSADVATHNVITKQNAAREAYLQVEKAMSEMATAEQALNEANAAIDEASAVIHRVSLAVPDKPKPKGGKS
jgi:hypothetical protein